MIWWLSDIGQPTLLRQIALVDEGIGDFARIEIYPV
jgi:hypothetical protein